MSKLMDKVSAENLPHKSKKTDKKLVKFQPIKISAEKIKKSNKVRQAALNNYTVAIKYKDKKGNISVREIEPYKIQGDSIWGFDIAKGEIRRFNLPGLKSAKPTKNKFNPRWGIEAGDERVARYMSRLMEKVASEEMEKVANDFQKLKKNKVALTPEERAECMSRKAVWHFNGGSPSPAVWKSVDKKTGEVTYVTNTHRAYNKAPTLKGAIGRFHNFIKSTA